MRDDRERLLDIQEAIERIEKYAVRGREAFERDELIQTWVLHHLQIIGEAVRALSPELTRETFGSRLVENRRDEKHSRPSLFQH